MPHPKSVLTIALETHLVPWARSRGFAAHSPYRYTRAVPGSESIVTFDIQRSKNPGDRTFTVNLGCWDPRTGNPPGKHKTVRPVDCAEPERIGRLMPRNPLYRGYAIVRYGSYWPHLVFVAFLGDFWWSYRATVASATAAVLHTRAQLETHGLPWLAGQPAVKSPASDLEDLPTPGT